MEETHNKNYFLFFILVVVALVATFFFTDHFKLIEEVRLATERKENLKIVLGNTPVLAKALSVYNITKNEKIYGKDDEVAMPIASLAKIITIAVGLNNYDSNEIISISNDAINQAGDFGIFANEKWKVGDLAKFTLLVSANDGAYALSEKDEKFIEKMNSKAKRLGAQNTLFLNTTGLDLSINDTDPPTKGGAYASAQDVNIMAMYALKAYPEIFSATTLPELNLKSESNFIHNFKNTNILVGKIPNLIFSKTGFTDIAGGNLIIIFKNKRGDDIVVTLLGSTFNDRFLDMEKIVEVLYNL